jgi:predicted amidohydrolase YtcJ
VRLVGMIAGALLCASCSEAPEGPPAPSVEAADLVVRGADVRTADPERTRATAFAVRAGRIVAVGSDAEIEPWLGADTSVVDAGGATVLPGFVDGHTHLALGSVLVAGVDLFGMPDKRQWLAAIAGKVDTLQPGEWVLGGRWDYTIAEHVYPTREELDAVAPDNPVALTDVDYHSMWVNSRALEAAGITGESEAPMGGEIVLDPATGEPTGILKETAMGLVGRSASFVEARQAAATDLAATVRYVNSLGITSVHDMAGPEVLAGYRDLADGGGLTLRVWFGMTDVVEEGRAAELAAVRADYRRSEEAFGPLLELGYLKHIIDGVLSTHTALMIEPYSDDPHADPEPFSEYEDLVRYVREGNGAGFPVATHAIGDRAVRMTLDSFEAAGVQGLANRIEHIEVVAPEDVPRFRELGVAASMQPNHGTGVIGKYITDRVGEERERHSYVWGDFLREGVHLALSSDWPTAPMSPLVQLADATLRESPYGLREGPWYPDQALSFDEALYAYTQANADLSAWGAEIGSLAVGKWADFVVLDGTLSAAPGRELLERRVAETWLAGQRLHP